MKRIILCIVCLLPISALSAAPLDKSQVSSTAKWLLHLDIDTFRQSSLGTLAIEKIRDEHSQQITSIQELLGSDPLQDIKQITLYGPNSNDKQAVLMICGRFNAEKLLALLALNPTYEKNAYQNYILHEWVDENHGKNQVGVFARKDLILLSQTRQPIEQALDVLDGKQLSLAQSGKLEYPNDAPSSPIILLTAQDIGQLTMDHVNTAILKNSKVMTFTASEENRNFSMTLDLQTQEAQTALQIEQALLGMKAFVLLNQKNQPALARLVQAIHVYTEGMRINLRFQYPSEALFSILKEYQILQKEIQREILDNQQQPSETEGAES